jgi:hypothetical protein
VQGHPPVLHGQGALDGVEACGEAQVQGEKGLTCSPSLPRSEC